MKNHNNLASYLNMSAVDVTNVDALIDTLRNNHYNFLPLAEMKEALLKKESVEPLLSEESYWTKRNVMAFLSTGQRECLMWE